jgi:PKD repeat protein
VIAFDTASISYGTQWEDSLLVGFDLSIMELELVLQSIDSLEALFLNNNIPFPLCAASIAGPDSAEVNQNFTLSNVMLNSNTSDLVHWKPYNTFGNSSSISEEIPGYFLYQVTNKNAQGGVLNRAFKLMHIVMPNINIPILLDTTNFYTIYESDTITLKTQQNSSDANGLIITWEDNGQVIAGANQNSLTYIAPNLSIIQAEFHLLKVTMHHPSFPILTRTQTWMLKVLPDSSYVFIIDSNGVVVANNVIYQNNFQSPNYTPNTGTCAFDLDIVNTVNQLWSGTGLGINASAIFSQKNTVETILINGPFNQYTDPQGIGGNFALGLQNLVEHDQVGLTFNVLSYPFVNTFLDLSAIGLNGCGLSGAILDTAKVRLILYDTPSGNFDINNPGFVLDSITLKGNEKGINDFTFNWKRVQASLSTIGNSNGNVTLLFEITNSAYAAIDNILIESSIDSIPSLSSFCTGSFGPAIINTTFGAGTTTDLANAVPNATTTYGFNPVCPSDGLYNIANTSFIACGQFVTGTDHTGDIDGRMMIVNADGNQAGEFYRQKMEGLCAGTTYQLAAWLANLTSPSAACGTIIPANVQFEVLDAFNLSSLGFVNTGNIPITSSLNWIQYDFEFTAVSDSVIIILKNNGLGGCGNDLAIDDITLRACSGGSLLTINSQDTLVCLGSTAIINAQVNATEELDFQWQKSIDNGLTWVDISNANTLEYEIPSFQTSDEGLYRLTAAPTGNIGSENCRFISNTNGISLNYNANPIANFTSTLIADSVILTNQSINAIHNFWSFGDNQSELSANPVHYYTTDGEYEINLLVINTCGISDTAMSIINICNSTPVIRISGMDKFCDTIGTRLILETCNTDSIKWYKDGFEILGENADTLDVINGGIYHCSILNNSQWKLSDTIVIQSFVSPIADFTLSQNCLTVTTTNLSSNAQSYVWDFGNTVSSALMNPTYMYNNQGNYLVSLSAKNNICIDTQSLFVSTLNTPVFNDIFATSCNNYVFNNQTLTQSGTYYDTLVNALGCDSIITLNVTINTTSYTVMNETACETYVFNNQTLTQSGTYYDTLVNAAGCDSIITLDITINVNPIPVIDVAGFSLSTQVFDSYQWYLNGNPIVGANAQTYTAVANGIYTVEVADVNTCAGISAGVNITTVSVRDFESNIAFKVFPNPTKDILTIQVDGKTAVNAKVYNVNGQMLDAFSFSENYVLNMESWVQGVYVVQLQDSLGNSLYAKVIKE